MYYLQRLRGLFLLLASAGLVLFASCQSEEGSGVATTPEGQGTITFSVSNYRQVSFDDLTSSATRAAGTIVMGLANLSLTVFNAETNEQVSPTILHKSGDYDDTPEKAKTFPLFSVTLPYGRYRVLVLGYNGSRECHITSLNHISWDDGYVPNTFLYCDEFTLDQSTNLDRTITLKRVVAAFRLDTEDALPAELKKMRFSSAAGGTVLDATTGFTSQNSGRTSEIVVPPDSLGKPGMFTSYLFLPSKELNTDYTVQALGNSDAVLYEKHFNNVPLRINVLTLWQGKFFTASDSGEAPGVQGGFSIEWDMDWDETLQFQP